VSDVPVEFRWHRASTGRWRTCWRDRNRFQLIHRTPGQDYVKACSTTHHLVQTKTNNLCMLSVVFSYYFYSALDRAAEYCEECVCLSVCLFARTSQEPHIIISHRANGSRPLKASVSEKYLCNVTFFIHKYYTITGAIEICFVVG